MTISSLPIMAIAPAFAGKEALALAAPPPPRQVGATQLGVVELLGSLSKPALVRAREQVYRLAADDRVGEVLVLVDSPGGTVAGTHDLYTAIARAAASKRVTAVVEDMACSGAYYAIAGATEIVGNATAHVGSIGAYIVMADASRLFEKMGVDVIVIRSGANKGAGVHGAKITSEQIAQLQAVVDEIGRHFVAAVAKGRRMSVAKVEALADGRILVGNQAKAAGLVDRVGVTFEAVLAEASGRTEHVLWAELKGRAAAKKFAELIEADRRIGEATGCEAARERMRLRHPKLAAAAGRYEKRKSEQFPRP